MKNISIIIAKHSLRNKFNELQGNIMNWYVLNKKRNRLNIGMALGLLFIVAIGCKSSPDIKVQDMTMKLPNSSQIFSEELLPGEIADTKIEHISYTGPISETVTLSLENVNMFLFIKGNGSLKADTLSYDIVPETIAIPF